MDTTHGTPAAGVRDGLALERSDGVARLTLARPERKNAVTAAGWSRLRMLLRELPATGDRVLVVTGAGQDFCAGADLSGEQPADLSARERMRIVGEACLALHRLPIPTVARSTVSRSERA